MKSQFTLIGKIIANQLGKFGSREIIYGYLTIEEETGKHTRIKVDSYTEWDTLSIGDMVEIQATELGNTGIITARRVILKPGPFFSSEDQSVAEMSA